MELNCSGVNSSLICGEPTHVLVDLRSTFSAADAEPTPAASKEMVEVRILIKVRYLKRVTVTSENLGRTETKETKGIQEMNPEVEDRFFKKRVVPRHPNGQTKVLG